MPQQKLPSWRSFLTVEPVILFYAYGLFTSLPLFRQYVYSVISDGKGFPYKELIMEKEGPGCHEDVFGANATLKRLEEEVQSLATKIDLGNTFFMTIPSLIVAPFWGPWTDKTGRTKPALIAPEIGGVLGTIVMLMVMYLDLPLYVMFVGSALIGSSGFLTTLSLAVMSYIANTTEKTGIAFRLAIMQMLVFTSGVISQLTSGLWINRFGFIAPTWLVLACLLASGLWAIFMVPELHNQTRANVKHKFFDLKNLKIPVNVFKKPRPGSARKTLLLVAVAGAILTVTDQGLGVVPALFVMRSPLCFGPTLVGYFLAYRMFLQGFGGVVGVKLFRICFSEKTTSLIAIINQMVEMGILAFADRTWLVFTAPALGFFSGAVGPILIAIASNTVEADEQGSLFCAYGILNIFSMFIGAMIFNNVYESTLGIGFNGLVFVLNAALKIFPLVIISCMHISPPEVEVQQIEMVDEEPGLKSEEANGNKQDDTL
ncbi:proton-coupled folate transporter-like [Porites lutea]|uniref:proton-coupled folate transporter-like n=1 Tax=Porites lutea TaxID=51062 RepID=UPI003CC52A92